jgi:hypothetical protein
MGTKTYAEMAEAAKKAHATRKISAAKWKPAADGDSFVGQLLAIDRAHSRVYDSDFNVYTFKCDEAPIKWVAGAGTDSELRGLLDVGQIYQVTFVRKEDTGGGQSRNIYDVVEIPGDTGE